MKGSGGAWLASGTVQCMFTNKKLFCYRKGGKKEGCRAGDRIDELETLMPFDLNSPFVAGDHMVQDTSYWKEKCVRLQNETQVTRKLKV